MTDNELVESYREAFTKMSWDDLMDQIHMYQDFPRMRVADPELYQLLMAENRRRVESGRLEP